MGDVHQMPEPATLTRVIGMLIMAKSRVRRIYPEPLYSPRVTFEIDDEGAMRFEARALAMVPIIGNGRSIDEAYSNLTVEMNARAAVLDGGDGL